MEKSWNSGKWQNHFPDLEKYNMEFEKKVKIMEKIMEFKNASWKNHRSLFFEILSHATFDVFSVRHACNWSFSFRIDHGKCSKNHGKLMEKSWNFILGNGCKPCTWYNTLNCGPKQVRIARGLRTSCKGVY